MVIKTSQNRWTIQDLMQKYQYSLRDLSPMTGLSPSMLCRLFNGERKFLTRHKLVITKIFNVEESSIKWPQKKYKTR